MTAQRIAGRYEVVRLLGEGSLGKVYHVRDHERDGIEATLKILRADAINYEELERHLEGWKERMLELDHPRLNPLEHVGQTPLGLLYLTSGYRRGENLRQLIARRGTVPAERALIIGRQILEGMAAAHDEGLVHGDLHPGNVLLLERVPSTLTDPYGTGVLLLDHGLYELVGAAPDEKNAAYQAPELASGTTTATDVFAVGALLRELIVGGDEDAPIPKVLAPLLDKATAKDPAKRFRDASAFLAALPVTTVASDGSETPSAPDEVVATALATIAERDEELASREQEVIVLAERADESERKLDEALSAKFAKLAERDATIETLRGEIASLASAKEEADSKGVPGENVWGFSDGVVDVPMSDEAPEESPAKPASRGGTMLALAFAVLALAMTILWWNERGKNEALAAPGKGSDMAALAALEQRALTAEAALKESDLQHAEALEAAVADRLSALEAAREESARIHGSAMEEAAEAHEAALADRDADVAASTAEVETWKESERTWREEANRLGAAYNEALAEAAEAERTRTALDGELKEARSRLTAAEEDLARARDPDLLALDQLDRVLSAIDALDGEAAQARRAGLVATWPDLAGLSVVEALAAATLELEQLTQETDSMALIGRLFDAVSRLEEARSDLPQLTESTWIHQEGGRRASAVRDAFAQLDRLAGEERAALATKLEGRWRTILHESPDTDPAEVLAVAEWFEDGRLTNFLDWYATFLQEATERGSMLELPELLKLRHLEAWGDVIAARPELHNQVGAREVMLFRFTRAWRSTPADEPPPALLVFFQDRDGTAPGIGWRRDIALRASLGHANSAWPGGAGGRFLYLTTATVDGESAQTWQLDEVTSASEGAWTLNRSYFRTDGSPLGSHDVELTRDGRRFTEAGRPGGPILDLMSERARPALWTSASGEPPAALVDPDEWEGFRTALGTAPIDALAYESGGVTGWYSPEWGCLAMESPGSFRRELVFAQPLRPLDQ